MSLFPPLPMSSEYVAGYPHWPRVLNYPPAALIATQTLMKYAKPSTTTPKSFATLKDFVQAQQAAGQGTVEIVSREVFEIAKTHLGALHWKLYDTIKVMQNLAHLTGLGAVLIAIGAIGIHLTQQKLVAEQETPKRNWTQVFSWGSLVTGLALITFTTYSLQSNANLLMKNFEVNY